MIPGLRKTANQATRWDTQDLAWEKAKDSKNTIALDLLSRLRERPSTCDELEVQTGLTHQTCSAAVNWLMNHGKIVPCGYRATRSKRTARVWRVAQSDDAPVVRRRDRKNELRELAAQVKLLQGQIMLLTHERDEARRMVCHYIASESALINVNNKSTVQQIATERSWDDLFESKP